MAPKGLICPYCGAPAILVPGRVIYPGRGDRDYTRRQYWACANFPACDSYVGVHAGTTTPLGRMANKELRTAKAAAHAVFDPLWLAKMERHGSSKQDARNAGYRWLADELGITVDKCHIGMFDLALCRRTIELCRNVRVVRRVKP